MKVFIKKYYIYLAIIIIAVTIVILIPDGVYLYIYWDYIIFFNDLIDLITSEIYFDNPEILDSFIKEYVIDDISSAALIFSSIFSLFVMIITIRFSFTLYIIGDTDENLLEALKKSWTITRGNWWRLFFFPLSFLLWFFAIIFTLGLALIYVTPYIKVAHASMYNHLLKENEFIFDDGFSRKRDDLTDDSALDEKQSKFDEKDPFDVYYK